MDPHQPPAGGPDRRHIALSDMSGVELRCLEQEDAFQSLRAQWNALAGSSICDSVFLRHEWFDAAWQWLRGDSALRVLCVHRDSTLIGICPLVLRREKHAGMSVRQLQFLAVPDTQLCDIIAAPEDVPLAAAAVGEWMKAGAAAWDIVDLRHVPANSPTLAALGARIGARQVDDDPNPVIALDGGWTAFYAGRSRSLKKANNLAANRLKKAGRIDIQWLHGAGADAAQVDKLLDEFVGISARSWKETTGLTLDNPGPGAFIRRLTLHAREQGWLSLWLLRLDDRPVAMEYQLSYRGDVHALRADFDQACNDISPGSHLNAVLLEQLFGGGLQRYCMGPGNNAYKRRWTDQADLLGRLTGYSPALRGKVVAFAAVTLRPMASRIKRMLTRAQTAEKK